MKIEEGKYYRTRDGRKVGPMVPSNGDWEDKTTWQFDANGNRWSGCPQMWRNGGEVLYPGPFDGDDHLVAEWTDGPVRTITRREVVPGHYGIVKVKQRMPQFSDRLANVAIQSTHASADELRAAAAVLLELAGALGE